MATSKTTNDLFLERLAEGLDSTSKLTHALLSEIRDSEADFASIKTELSILRENVKGLSEIVREGNGATSILTRIALIEARIQNIEKWMETHIDLHQEENADVSKAQEQLKDLDKKIAALTSVVNELKSHADDIEKKRRESIDRELELQHEDKKSKIGVAAERQQTIIKVLGALLLAVLGAAGGYLANSCHGTAGAAQPRSVIVAPSAAPILAQPAEPIKENLTPQPPSQPLLQPSVSAVAKRTR
jgi:chromosome segregation ATPase